MNIRLFPLRGLLVAFAVALGSGAAAAQIELTGSLSDDTTGPLLGGQVYHLNGNLSVPLGKTLTVQAGAILKGRPNSRILSQGTVLINGTPGNRVVLTSIKDDSAGGDTNMDGPSTGSPGDWRGLFFYASASASVVSYADVSYTGGAGDGGIAISASGHVFDNVNVQDGLSAGLDLSNRITTVTNCGFYNNAGVAVDRVALESVPFFSGNLASGNGQGNYERVMSFAHTGDVTITPANCIGGVLVLSMGGISVQGGYQLNLGAGLIVKAELSATHFLVQGELNAMGTAGSQVIFTTLADDSVGGDTANDGATSATPGSWRGLYFYPSASGSTLQDAVIQYAGISGYYPLTLADSAVTVRDCTIRNNSLGGIDFSTGSSGAIISGCSIHDNAGLAMGRVPLQAVPGFSNNQAWDNAAGDYIQVINFSHSQDLTIGLDNVLNGQLVLVMGGISVAPGKRLTFGEGLVIKFSGPGHFLTQGQLEIAGTPTNPVVFTALDDDDYGGDTTKNGPTQGTPGAWRGLYFYPSASLSTVDNAIIRYTGNSGYSGVGIGQGVSLTNTVIRDGALDAISLVGTGAGITISGCSFLDNGGMAANVFSLESLAGVSGNQASGNAGGDYTRVTVASLSADLTLTPDNVIGGLLRLSVNVAGSAGNVLTFGPGMVLKMDLNRHWLMVGALSLLGTEEAPIRLTSFYDDTVVGDSDLGAGPPPAPGDWRGIYIYPQASPVIIRNTILSYVGGAGYPGVQVNSSSVTLDRVRVQYSASDGFEFTTDQLVDPTHLTAYQCAGRGVDLRAGGFTLRRTTAVESGLEGIYADPAFAGSVLNSISRDNLNGNFVGFTTPGTVTYSNGSAAMAGSDGNMDQDPLFMDPLTGDFRLQESSPCVDAGHPQSPADPDLSQADMGAYYFDHCTPKAICAGKLNSQGCLPAIDWTGSPSATGDDDFAVHASNIIGQQSGYLLLSQALVPPNPGQIGASLLGTRFCAFRPRFLVKVDSGGTANTCDGSFNVLLSQSLMAAEGLVPGSTAYVQFVYQDPAHPDGSGWGQTNALRFGLCP